MAVLTLRSSRKQRRGTASGTHRVGFFHPGEVFLYLADADIYIWDVPVL
jgi:hypothetical protein